MGHTRKSNQKPKEKPENPSQKVKSADGHEPFAPQNPRSLSDPDRSSKDKQFPAPWWKRWVFWKRVIEVLGFFALILYAAVTYLQWHDLRGNFEAEQRAWIRTGISWPNLVSDQPAVGKLVVKNIGKSPVTRLHCAVRLEILRKDSEPSLSASEKYLQVDTSIIFPTDETSFQVYLPDKAGNARTFTSEELQALTDGGDYLAMYGMVTYVDQFGVHWTRFCGWQSKANGGSFNASRCIAWNLTGDGSPPVE